jgi:hypothetical protein
VIEGIVVYSKIIRASATNIFIISIPALLFISTFICGMNTQAAAQVIRPLYSPSPELLRLINILINPKSRHKPNNSQLSV